ncbi:MAG: hypothetical protein KDK34_22045 [Leptospiraceae bacterium]|nr:hypothetical protein [Leptospiraceae bacterium]
MAQPVSDRRNFALETLKQYAPEGYAIVQAYSSFPEEITVGNRRVRLPRTDFAIYLRGSNRLQLLGSLSTVVHEITHGYTHRFPQQHGTIDVNAEDPGAGWNNAQAYLIGDATVEDPIVVTKTEVFRTNAIADQIPVECHSLRYKTYVASTEPHLGAQVDGVYGLLDEWHAYYQGVRTTFELYPYYQNELPGDIATWSAYYQDFYGSDYAYLEFKYFILKYLQFARRKYPDIYTGIMQNQAFRKVYRQLDIQFVNLITAFEERNVEIETSLAKADITMTRDATVLWFYKAGDRNRVGIGHFRDVYASFEKALQEAELQEIHAALVNDANSTIYETTDKDS